MANTQQSSTKQEILEYLLKHVQATALELSTALDISPQAVRRHLKDLDAEKLILYSSSVQAGMGRPQHVYQLSSEGKNYLNWVASPQNSGDGYGQFAVSLLDTLAQTVGKDQVSTILKKQWERKAEEYRKSLGDGPLSKRVANLVELRKAEGYMAEYHPIDTKSSKLGDYSGSNSSGSNSSGSNSSGSNNSGNNNSGNNNSGSNKSGNNNSGSNKSGNNKPGNNKPGNNKPGNNKSGNNKSRDKLSDRFMILEHNCAISNVAESFPSVCGHELEMFAAALPDCTVERTHWMIDGEHRCGYLVQAKKK